MDYNFFKRLKDAGFPHEFIGLDFTLQHIAEGNISKDSISLPWEISCPTLSELIKACDTVFFDLIKVSDGWTANDHYRVGKGETPEEAVGYLWLILNEKTP